MALVLDRLKIYQNIDDFRGVAKPVITTGTFDGVHRGHRKILEQLRDLADELDGETVLLTFQPHPRKVLFPDADLQLLNTLDEKIALLASTKLDHLIIQPFTSEFSRITPEDFIRNILVKKIGAIGVVAGYDHHFGRNREGAFRELEQFADMLKFKVREIPAYVTDDVAVSSTKIRAALREGDIARVNQYLASRFFLTGRVIPGNRLGRELGFPTANLSVDNENKMLPAIGVYAAEVILEGKKYPAMLNIGTRPTVGGTGVKLEVHIIHFDGDLYDQELRLMLIARLRNEQKFQSIEQLVVQLKRDREETLKITAR